MLGQCVRDKNHACTCKNVVWLLVSFDQFGVTQHCPTFPVGPVVSNRGIKNYTVADWAVGRCTVNGLSRVSFRVILFMCSNKFW